MNFIKLSDPAKSTKILFAEIKGSTKLYNRITWIVSGGSNIEIAASVFRKLNDSDLSKLTIMLADERFGKVGHLNSNFYQLERAGVNFHKVSNFPVLLKNFPSLKSTTSNYAKVVKRVFNRSDFIIGQLGIGDDGHTAGILPNTVAAEESGDLVIGYQANDYSRISLSFKAIRQISKIFVFAFGEQKHLAISNLINNKLSLQEEPAQIYRQLADVYIINNMLGDKL